MTVKFTKTELRAQQHRFTQLNRYLPTLQLKKMLLQLEVASVEAELERLQLECEEKRARLEMSAPLFADKYAFDLMPAIGIERIETKEEHIAGLDIRLFERVVFKEPDALLFGSPVWLDQAILATRELISLQEWIRLVEAKKRALEKELRDVSIRVNLFDKILIPRAQQNIKKIRIFLGDQLLAAVSQAKVSKRKLLGSA